MAAAVSSPGGPAARAPEPLVVTLHVGDSRFAVLSVPLHHGSLVAALTVAEREVAALAAAGLGNAAIAKCRSTSERKVDNQMAALLRKLKVGSRHELTALLALTRL